MRQRRRSHSCLFDVAEPRDVGQVLGTPRSKLVLNEEGFVEKRKLHAAHRGELSTCTRLLEIDRRDAGKQIDSSRFDTELYDFVRR